MARKAKAPDDEPIEGEDPVEEVAPVEAPAPQPELWQELELDEATYKGKDAAEIARDLRRQQRESETEFQQKYADAGLAAYRYANESIRQTPEWNEFQEYRAKQAEATKEPAKKWYDRPDFDPTILEDYRVVNEDGTKGPVDRKALAAAGLLDKALAYQQFIEQHDGRWERDREGYLDSYLDHALEGRVNKYIEAAKGKWEEERDWQEWDRSNADWMYVHDKPLQEGGKRVIDPNTGRWALTQEGLTFHQLYNELRQEGLSSSRSARDRATQIMLGMFAAHAQPAKAPQPAGEPANGAPKKDKHLDHIRNVASRQSGRGGTVDDGGGRKNQQSKKPKWEDEFVANFSQRIGLNAGA